MGVRTAVLEVLGNPQELVEMSDTRHHPLIEHLIGDISSSTDAENQNDLREFETSAYNTANQDESYEEIDDLSPQRTPVPEEIISSDEEPLDAPSPKMSPPRCAVPTSSKGNRSPAVRAPDYDKRQNEGDQVGFLQNLVRFIILNRYNKLVPIT